MLKKQLIMLLTKLQKAFGLSRITQQVRVAQTSQDECMLPILPFCIYLLTKWKAVGPTVAARKKWNKTNTNGVRCAHDFSQHFWSYRVGRTFSRWIISATWNPIHCPNCTTQPLWYTNEFQFRDSFIFEVQLTQTKWMNEQWASPWWRPSYPVRYLLATRHFSFDFFFWANNQRHTVNAYSLPRTLRSMNLILTMWEKQRTSATKKLKHKMCQYWFWLQFGKKQEGKETKCIENIVTDDKLPIFNSHSPSRARTESPTIIE